ncbi:hypothetical protein IHV10_22355 [Fictibacillus sp. 5RED26]|uniref:hypothetical protein n=1 Tax=Fictibacillus sp. 5RED26 TaxID=2745876 RepID=UPI0018CE1755|nr:hypothetical protein [Fictibacillus sp. 5RED26]
MLNNQSKERLKKLNNLLVTSLEAAFNVTVYQDQVSEDEETDYHYFIYETGGFTKKAEQNKSLLVQDVTLRYYSENRDDLDEVTIDIITLLERNGHIFKNSLKAAIQKGDTDSYVDEIELNFTRAFKYVIE